MTLVQIHTSFYFEIYSEIHIHFEVHITSVTALWDSDSHVTIELQHLIYPRILAGFDMLVFFTNLSIMEFQVRYVTLFFLFSVLDSFEWFWMKSLHKNIQLRLEFLNAPSLVLHFSYSTLMIFYMIH